MWFQRTKSENLYKLEVKHLNFINCVFNSCNLKNVCSLARHWLWTVWWWHESVETCSSVNYTKILLWYILLWDNCVFVGYYKKYNTHGTCITIMYQAVSRNLQIHGLCIQWNFYFMLPSGLVTYETFNSRIVCGNHGCYWRRFGKFLLHFQKRFLRVK
jgi:hypothetical protein